MNFSQVEKRLDKVRELESELRSFYKNGSKMLGDCQKHTYIKELMKDLKYDMDSIQ